MKTNTALIDIPGTGDLETWGPCTGHPGDPRTEIEVREIDPTNEINAILEMAADGLDEEEMILWEAIGPDAIPDFALGLHRARIVRAIRDEDAETLGQLILAAAQDYIRDAALRRLGEAA